jgi:acetyltransferase-like isoleucine patch superfamily enzyme
VRIGKATVIGAGSLVLNDIPDDVLAYGSPARLVRSLSHG